MRQRNKLTLTLTYFKDVSSVKSASYLEREESVKSSSYIDKDVTSATSISHTDVVAVEDVKTSETTSSSTTTGISRDIKTLKLSSDSEVDRDNDSEILSRRCLFSCNDEEACCSNTCTKFQKGKPIRLDIDMNSKREQSEKQYASKSRTSRRHLEYSSSDTEASETDVSTAYYNSYISAYKRDRELYSQLPSEKRHKKSIKVDLETTDMEFAPVVTTNKKSAKSSSTSESDSDHVFYEEKKGASVSEETKEAVIKTLSTTEENVAEMAKVKKPCPIHHQHSHHSHTTTSQQALQQHDQQQQQRYENFRSKRKQSSSTAANVSSSSLQVTKSASNTPNMVRKKIPRHILSGKQVFEILFVSFSS